MATMPAISVRVEVKCVRCLGGYIFVVGGN